MKIQFTKNQDNLHIALEGRLDTTTAPELENFLKEHLGTVRTIEMDCEKLTYVSSAGLRVLLSIHKRLVGSVTLTNVCELVMEIFEITGFIDVLTIK